MSVYLTGWSFDYRGGHRDVDLFVDGRLAGMSRSPIIQMKIEVTADSTIDAERFRVFMETAFGSGFFDSHSVRHGVCRSVDSDRLLEAFVMLMRLRPGDFDATITSMGVKLGHQRNVFTGG